MLSCRGGGVQLDFILCWSTRLDNGTKKKVNKHCDKNVHKKEVWKVKKGRCAYYVEISTRICASKGKEIQQVKGEDKRKLWKQVRTLTKSICWQRTSWIFLVHKMIHLASMYWSRLAYQDQQRMENSSGLSLSRPRLFSRRWSKMADLPGFKVWPKLNAVAGTCFLILVSRHCGIFPIYQHLHQY